MELTVKNIETYFSILDKFKKENLFNAAQMFEYTEKELNLFNDKENAEMTKEQFEKFQIYMTTLHFLQVDVLPLFNQALNKDISIYELRDFNNNIREKYNYIDKIMERINQINSDYYNNIKNNKDKITKERNKKIARQKKMFKEYDSNYLNRIVEIGIMKGALKKHLNTDAHDLLLEDAFNRYFKLVITGITDE